MRTSMVRLRSKLGLSFLTAASAIILGAPHALAQPLDSSFTYQGRLNSVGNPASGTYDLRFRLYSAAAGGSPVGVTLCSDNIAIVDGTFAVRLDFGAQFAGQQRFLEIDVRQDTGLACGNVTGFTTLAPRQALTASPNAAYALAAGTATTATNATQLNGQAASFYQNAANLTAGSIPDGRLGGTYSGAITFSNAANSITGSGAGLSNVNAAQLGGSGLAAFGRLATGQTWTAANTFSSASNSFTGTFTGSGAGITGVNADLLDGINGTAFGQLAAGQSWTAANTFSNASNSFTGNGAGLTNVNAAQLGGSALAAFGRLATGQTWTAANTFSNASNAFTGTFTGGGAGITGVNATLLDGLDSIAFGRLAASQTWPGVNDFNNPGNFFEGTFIGNGGALTGVNAAQLGGHALAAFGRLATNQQWTGVNNFSGVSNTFTGSQFNGGFFNGNGSGLTNVNAATLDGIDSTAFLQAVPVPLTMSGDQSPLAVLTVINTTTQSTGSAIFASRSTATGDASSAIWGQIGDGATDIGAGVAGVHYGGGRGVRGYSDRGVGVWAHAGVVGTALHAEGASRLDGVVELMPGRFLSIGAGNSPAVPLHFQSSLGPKIGLYGADTNTSYGLGIQPSTLQIYTDVPSSAIALGSGVSFSFTERVRFSGDADMIFRNDGLDVASTIQAPYDLIIRHDRDNDNFDSWLRFYTNGGGIEQFRIEDGDEAAAKFDGAVAANGIDYAEAFKAADPTLEPGDLVVSSGNWESIVRSSHAYDAAVIGVISTRPAFVAGMSFDAEDRIDPALTARRDAARAAGDTALEKQLTMQLSALVKQAYRPVAFMGRVPTKVIGAVKIGDHLCAASVAGRAMAMSTAGHSVGIALEASDGGERTIMVLVQPKYHVPAIADDGEAAGELGQLAAQLQRVIVENDDLRARLERLEVLLGER